MTDTDLSKLLNQIPSAFNPANAAGLDVDIQLHLVGENGGDWVMGIHKQRCTIQEGTAPAPRVTIQTHSEDLKALFDGRMNITRAFMSGKLHLQGDMGFAMSLAKLFRKG
ncbi:MAG: SCP2 sterol-binding domain-containing protein [Anaerolineaceae bacterium]